MDSSISSDLKITELGSGCQENEKYHSRGPHLLLSHVESHMVAAGVDITMTDIPILPVVLLTCPLCVEFHNHCTVELLLRREVINTGNLKIVIRLQVM
jgi:hypothetical protein